MADKEVRIDIKSTASGTGAKDTKAGLKSVSDAALSAGISVDKLEKELKQAENALKQADVGSKEFKKLQLEIGRTKNALKGLKVGNLDSKGIDRLNRRLSSLKTRAQAAKGALEKKPSTGWVTQLKAKFDSLSASLPKGGRVGGFLSKITSGAGLATIAVSSLVASVAGLAGTVRSGIGNIALFQDLEASFTTLLGSIELAQSKLADIREIAGSTPISVGDLATVGRQLETLTAGALGTKDALLLVGDAAAVAQRPGETLGTTAQNLALHVGRLFSSLKSGKGEIGESTLRLQEMGLITPELSFQLREMHKETGRGAEAWALLEESLGKFDGELKRRSNTINGAINNLGDAWDQFAATVAAPFAGPFKTNVQVITAGLDTLRSGLSTTWSAIRVLFGGVSDSAKAASLDVAKSAKEARDALGKAFDEVESGAEAAKTAVRGITTAFDESREAAERLLKEQQEIAELELKIKLGDIDDNGALDAVEKLQAKSEARLAALAAGHSLRLNEARNAVQEEQSRLRELTDLFDITAAGAELAQDKLEEAQERDKGDDSARKTNDRKLKAAELKLRRAELELADSQSRTVDGPSGQIQLGGDAKLIAAAKAKIKLATETRDKLKAVQAKGEQDLERLRRDALARKEKASELGSSLKAQQTSSAKGIALLQREISHLERKAALQQEEANKDANRQVRKSTISQLETEAKDGEKAITERIKVAEDARKDQAKRVLDVLSKLEGVADEGFSLQFDEAEGDIKEGKVEKAAALAAKALKGREKEMRLLGATLGETLKNFKQAEKEILESQRALVDAKKDAIDKIKAANEKVFITDVPDVDQGVRRRLINKLPKPETVTQDVQLVAKPDIGAVQEVQQRVVGNLPDPEPVTREVADKVAIEPTGGIVRDVAELADALTQAGAAQLSKAVTDAAAGISQQEGGQALKDALLQSLDAVAGDEDTTKLVSGLLGRVNQLETTSDGREALKRSQESRGLTAKDVQELIKQREDERRVDAPPETKSTPPAPPAQPDSEIERLRQQRLESIKGRKFDEPAERFIPSYQESFTDAQPARPSQSEQPGIIDGGSDAVIAARDNSDALRATFASLVRATGDGSRVALDSITQLQAVVETAADNQQALQAANVALLAKLTTLSGQVANLRA